MNTANLINDHMSESRGCPAGCPGCQPDHRDDIDSAAIKTAWLRRMLAPWEDRLAPIQYPIGTARFSYRDKTCLSARWTEKGWHVGLNVDKQILPIPDCPVHTARIKQALAILLECFPPERDFPLKYYAQSGAQLTLVLKTRRMPDMTWLDGTIQRRLMAAGIDGVWLHLFPSVGKRVFAKNEWHLAAGSPRSYDAEGFEYGPTSFQQLVADLHGQALDRAEAHLAPESGDAVIDLYAGTGRTLARWTKRGARACGVELSGEAADCARRNAPDATLLRGACAHRLPQLDQWLSAHAPSRPLVYVNPPRTGLEPDVREWIAGQCRPLKMAYLSCSAGTLARDLEFFCSHDFRVNRMIPFDFFPNTRHVEVLALLEGDRKWRPSGIHK